MADQSQTIGFATARPSAELVKGLGLLDSTMIVIGSMIGSGIFIVAADISRQVQSPGLLLTVWLVSGVMTLIGALSYGELAAAMPHAGGQYVYLRESLGEIWGFLYGWTMLLVIQTGTIAAVGIAFAKFAGVLFPVAFLFSLDSEARHIRSLDALVRSSRPLRRWPESPEFSGHRRDCLSLLAEYARLADRLPGSECFHLCEDGRARRAGFDWFLVFHGPRPRREFHGFLAQFRSRFDASVSTRKSHLENRNHHAGRSRPGRRSFSIRCLEQHHLHRC